MTSIKGPNPFSACGLTRRIRPRKKREGWAAAHLRRGTHLETRNFLDKPQNAIQLVVQEQRYAGCHRLVGRSACSGCWWRCLVVSSPWSPCTVCSSVRDVTRTLVHRAVERLVHSLVLRYRPVTRRRGRRGAHGFYPLLYQFPEASRVGLLHEPVVAVPANATTVLESELEENNFKCNIFG